MSISLHLIYAKEIQICFSFITRHTFHGPAPTSAGTASLWSQTCCSSTDVCRMLPSPMVANMWPSRSCRKACWPRATFSLTVGLGCQFWIWLSSWAKRMKSSAEGCRRRRPATGLPSSSCPIMRRPRSKTEGIRRIRSSQQPHRLPMYEDATSSVARSSRSLLRKSWSLSRTSMEIMLTVAV
ncbi:hypothetical protein ColKHC_13085 [Colletotrichum higginsianum]|nr:hypothetical protein ColKHC_13085 [Colletotrichum higginsianum]